MVNRRFRSKILEKLDEDVSALALRDLLKEKKLRWSAKLTAPMLSQA